MTEYRFMMSVELDKIAPDLLAFQREVVDPRKDAKNPHFNSKFVPLESAIEALRPMANKHNMSITQWRVGKGLTTLVMHASGQYIRGDAEMVLDKLTPQGLGSAVTYERRYSLLAATGTSGDVDDDAEAAMGRDARKPAGASEADKKQGQVEMFASMIGGAATVDDLKEIWHEVNDAHLIPSQVAMLEMLKDTAKKRLQ